MSSTTRIPQTHLFSAYLSFMSLTGSLGLMLTHCEPEHELALLCADGACSASAGDVAAPAGFGGMGADEATALRCKPVSNSLWLEDDDTPNAPPVPCEPIKPS